MNIHKTGRLVLGLSALMFSHVMAQGWEPPAEVAREQMIADSQEVLGMPDIPISVKEDIFRIKAVEMDWDVGGAVFEPEDESKIPKGPDGKK